MLHSPEDMAIAGESTEVNSSVLIIYIFKKEEKKTAVARCVQLYQSQIMHRAEL